MYRQNRMARTLATLVISMTIGAAVLDFFQPAPPHRSFVGIELTAVGSTLSNVWGDIDITRHNAAEKQSPERAHFFIQADGSCTVTESWKQQKPVGTAGIIRIALVIPAGSKRVAGLQWRATGQLCQELQARCNLGPQQVTIDQSLEVPRPSAF